jgi:hypothetical protein
MFGEFFSGQFGEFFSPCMWYLPVVSAWGSVWGIFFVLFFWGIFFILFFFVGSYNLAFCMVFAGFGSYYLAFRMVFAGFWSLLFLLFLLFLLWVCQQKPSNIEF